MRSRLLISLGIVFGAALWVSAECPSQYQIPPSLVDVIENQAGTNGWRRFLTLRVQLQCDGYPVFRVFNIRQDSSGEVGEVRILQFDASGNPFTEETQVILQKGSDGRFTGTIRGASVSLRFQEGQFPAGQFSFSLRAFLGGIDIEAPYNADGIVLSGATTRFISVMTQDQGRWEFQDRAGNRRPYPRRPNR